MSKRQHKPITSVAVDRAVLALERLMEAPDYEKVLSLNADYYIKGLHKELLRIWSDLKDEGR